MTAVYIFSRYELFAVVNLSYSYVVGKCTGNLVGVHGVVDRTAFDVWLKVPSLRVALNWPCFEAMRILVCRYCEAANFKFVSFDIFSAYNY